MLRKIARNMIIAVVVVNWILGSVGINSSTAFAATQLAAQSVTNSPSSDILVFVDGQQIHFEDQLPIIVDGRTLVPVRGVFEHMGFTVEWIDATRTAMLEGPEHSIMIPVDEATFIVQRAADFGVPHTITPDVPQQIINGRTMLPLRAVSEAIGVGVVWDGDSRQVLIDTGANNGDANTATDTLVTEPISTPSPLSEPSSDEWTQQFLYTQSSIILPNRRLTYVERQEWIDEYWANGGASAFELEVIRLVNEIRATHGLCEFEIDDTLMMAARFYSQTLGNLNLPVGHNEGPYGGSRNTVHAFGMARGIANGNAGARTPEALVDSWMNSPGHRENLLRQTTLTLVGFGSHLEGQRTLHYLVTGE